MIYTSKSFRIEALGDKAHMQYIVSPIITGSRSIEKLIDAFNEHSKFARDYKMVRVTSDYMCELVPNNRAVDIPESKLQSIVNECEALDEQYGNMFNIYGGVIYTNFNLRPDVYTKFMKAYNTLKVDSDNAWIVESYFNSPRCDNIDVLRHRAFELRSLSSDYSDDKRQEKLVKLLEDSYHFIFKY